MKYVIVLGDGMADEPIAELGNKTPLIAVDKFKNKLFIRLNFYKNSKK